METQTVIIGAGLSGLNCARILHQHRRDCLVLEAGGRIGGRVRTDAVGGYRLDHGFQVLQTAYPEAARALDFTRLDLHRFPSGVAVGKDGRSHIIADPRRHPEALLSTALAPIGSLKDRLLMLRLALSLRSGSLESLFQGRERRTCDFLRDYGFSRRFIDSFFVPFFAGATLDRRLTASSRVFQYIFRVFAQGDATLPAFGMAEIPNQLAETLPGDRIRLHSQVAAINEGGVTLEDGTTIGARNVILATPAPETRRLLGRAQGNGSVAETCIYFGAEWKPPLARPYLFLNGDADGPVNNIAFPSLVSPKYAPPGKTLIAVVVLGEEFHGAADLVDQVRNQCRDWFGPAADDWEHLRTYAIPHALPLQEPPTANPYAASSGGAERIRICGEYASLPGTQWALLSGRLAAERLLGETS